MVCILLMKQFDPIARSRDVAISDVPLALSSP